jgi:hypothetical protein
MILHEAILSPSVKEKGQGDRGVFDALIHCFFKFQSYRDQLPFLQP